jgi:gamma-glutamylcyclotransferase
MAGKQSYFPRRRVRKITETGTRKWIINKKGYTNIIPSPNDYVWGTVLLLHAHDERNLDDTEGDEYVKSIRPVQAVDMKLKPDPSIVVYFDKDYTTPGRPLPSFVRTLEKAMEDGKKRGIPQSYFDKYWKPFLTNPYVGTETAEAE